MTELQHIITIQTEFQNTRYDQILASLLPQFSRSYLQKYLQELGLKIQRDNAVIIIKQAKFKAKFGDRIYLPAELRQAHINHTTVHNQQINWQATANDPAEFASWLHYEDEALLIINKPAQLSMHPGAGALNHTLINYLLHHRPELQALPRAGLVHRLDKDTTGLVIVAKTLTAQHQLNQQILQRQISRTYLAVTQGRLAKLQATINAHLARDPHNRLRRTVVSEHYNGGKAAITHYQCLAISGVYSYIKVKLETGRTHQIRAHMRYLNCPLVGDKLYNGRTTIIQPTTKQQQQFNRPALHAYNLQFYHPNTQELVNFTQELPEDFKNLLEFLTVTCVDS